MDWVNYNFVFIVQVYLPKSRADSLFHKASPSRTGHYLKLVHIISNSGEWLRSRRSNVVVLRQYSINNNEASLLPYMHSLIFLDASAL